ncbi:hypothetical protein [Melittangium boletus]|uniref:Uncharacterized protein n=1 Tax=Melittangium boletus DSM 14713 TaxID=1294270 RepID=A0A250IAJ2_9BACT|nr:hypothetical protein [Melittangium boletus]ATB28220.1 hypothetical protein MEBOL_001666 [Melittangium boletus DSM 14713]
MNHRLLWSAVGVVSMLASACGQVEQDGTQTQDPLASSVSQSVLVNAPQKETITYPLKAVIYPNSATLSTQPTQAELDQIRQKVYEQLAAHATTIRNASNGLLNPVASLSYVTVNNNRRLEMTDFRLHGSYWGFADATTNTILSQDFGGQHPAYAYPMFDSSYSSANLTYGNGLVSVVSRNGAADQGYLNHEFMHVLENRFHNADSNTQIVPADSLNPVDHPEYTSCISTSETREASNPNAVSFNSEVLLQNIMSEYKSCNGGKLNWCQLYTGAGKLGTFSSDLCADSSFKLNPKLTHSWLRQAYMQGADWLYLEWDRVTDTSQYQVQVELLTTSNTPVTQLSRTDAGASDRGDFRYYYYNKTDLCNAVRSAGYSSGTYKMRARVKPTVDLGRGHRMDVSGTLSCSFYAMDPSYTYWLSGHGGSGGSSVQPTCPSNSVAVGLVGRSVAYVDALGLLCAAVNSDGSLGSAYSYGPYGGSSGTSFTDFCPSGQVLVSIKGRSYSWHDQISGVCAPLKTWGSTGSLGSSLPARGGSGGAPYTETCPMGYAITALSMRAATYVDYVQGRCTRIRN